MILKKRNKQKKSPKNIVHSQDPETVGEGKVVAHRMAISCWGAH